MDSFEELGVGEPLIEALAAEGVEAPTSLQGKAMPVLGRGHDLVLRSGPGAGIVVAYGVPMLERLTPDGPAGQAIVAVPDQLRAAGVAESLGRLALPLGLQVSALDRGWAEADRAQVIVGTPEALRAGIASSGIAGPGTLVLVLDGLSLMLGAGMLEALEAILSTVPAEAQRIAVALPITDETQGFADRHLTRATHVPPRLTEGVGDLVRRGTVEFAMVREDRVVETIDQVARLLAGGASQVLVFCRTEDRAADLGDLLDLRGFRSGYPGEEEAAVWLGVDDLAGLAALRASAASDSIATLSMDVPTDPDALDRRHGSGSTALVMVLPREIPHLGEVAREAGYGLRSPLAGLETPSGGKDSGARLPVELFDLMGKGPKAFATPEVAQLVGRFSADAVAGAAVKLLLERGLADPVVEAGEDPDAIPSGVPTWVKVFLTVGERDEVTVGDLLGAITGEADIEGSHVGRIEIKDTYSRVEIRADLAPRVVRGLNGTSIRGRSVRADYDRGAARPPGGRGETKRAPRRKMKPRD
jgi:ATP-dependent RNA helicase DeaD